MVEGVALERKDSFMKRFKEKTVGLAGDFSKGILIPVFVLPIVGLLLALGIVLTNQSIAGVAPVIGDLGKIITSSMLSIFINLSPIFAVGIACGMAKKEKGKAGLTSLVLFFVFLYSMNSFMDIKGILLSGVDLTGTGQNNVLGVQVLDMGVFLGMIIGLISGILHNKTVDKEFEGAMRIYGGANLGLLIGMPIIVALAIVCTYIWPAIQTQIIKATNLIVSTGAFGVGLYGFLERILIPTGLHHLIWVPVDLSSISGVATIDGQVYEGVKNIAYAELASPNVAKLSHGAVFLSRSICKMFGLVGASLAMYKCALPENKVRVKALLIPAVGASILAGVTEPIEFSFLFTAPILFVIHSILTGVGMAANALFDIRVISGGGAIEFFATMLPAWSKGDGFKFILLGLVEGVVYYYIFKFCILKFNLKTPGRTKKETKLYNKADYKNKVNGSKDESSREVGLKIIDALGGRENIIRVENCFSRLRVELHDKKLFVEEKIEGTNYNGIVDTPTGVQIIYGLKVQKIRKQIDGILEESN